MKEAVAEIAAVTGRPRREVYQRALALAKAEAPTMSAMKPPRAAPGLRGRRRGRSARSRSALGLSAESRAAALLIAKGFRILARRWRSPVGEIDIVARRRHLLVFVEVKAREPLDDAAWSVTERQRARIVAAAEAWLARYPGREHPRHPLRRHAGRARPDAAAHPGSVRREHVIKR